MESIRHYILSVICIVIICGILQLLLHSGITASIVKFLSGLIVTITVLNPLIQDRILQWDSVFEDISISGQLAVTEGEEAAQNAHKELIKQKTEAYILTMATQLGADITVDVQLLDAYPNTPQRVKVMGKLSPYVRQQLANCLQQDLGIAEENQIWILQN